VTLSDQRQGQKWLCLRQIKDSNRFKLMEGIMKRSFQKVPIFGLQRVFPLEEFLNPNSR